MSDGAIATLASVSCLPHLLSSPPPPLCQRRRCRHFLCKWIQCCCWGCREKNAATGQAVVCFLRYWGILGYPSIFDILGHISYCLTFNNNNSKDEAKVVDGKQCPRQIYERGCNGPSVFGMPSVFNSCGAAVFFSFLMLESLTATNARVPSQRRSRSLCLHVLTCPRCVAYTLEVLFISILRIFVEYMF